ncbi:hypothetical protein ACH3VR_12925 [Microbacterium sp. B2969]|uniref:Uncharacterized protein n=1 Tax=Microbacterium alkaliflavum TaxID=3248839 RepID=A0ABW7Q9Y6_9MICO
MYTEDPAQTEPGKKRDCRPPTPEGGCNPSSAIDKRKSRDKGLAAQLDYSKEHDQALEDAKKTYDESRKGYREKRHEAVLKVQDMKHQVKHLIERIKCLIEQDRVVRCLDDAFHEVCEQLDCCEGPGGCCVEDFEFDTTMPPDTERGDRKLAHRIERYKAEIAKAKDCFTTLSGEPAALEKRVADAKTEIDAILAALADDAAKVDLKKQYVSALLAERRLARIWNGFPDTNAYIDCLCKALQIWSDGVDAVSLLVAEQAVRDYAEESEQTWCTALIGGPVAEILAVYDRLCGSDKPCGTDKPEEPEDEHSEDCGCGKHKHTHTHDHDHGDHDHYGDGAESTGEQTQSA